MQPGDIISDRFEIDRLVGSGAMGVVFRARDHATGDLVAVKVLRDAHEQASRFEREAEVLAALHHEHVVRYIAHGATSMDEPYLVMEWIEGEDLGRRLARGRLRMEAWVALGARVAAALAEAHAHGVIHRDVKPTNLVLANGEVARVKVVDFGIARRSGWTRATQTGAVLGTPGYMPPEQARGEDVRDPRADMFSLGCVLFECATSAPVFAGQHLPAILAKILFEPAPRARSLSPEVPEVLDELIARMLSKNPSERPTSMEVASSLASLERVAAAELGPVSVRPLSSAPALTADEQRVLSVVIVGAPPVSDLDAAQASEASAADLAALRRVTLARGARLEPMADGSMAAILNEALPPLDEASQAARLARDLHAVAPDRPVVMATGRGGGLFKRTVGDAINRAVRLLDAVTRAGALPDAPLVDTISARLLDKRFEVRSSPPGYAIIGEHDAGAMTRTFLGRESPYVGRKAELGMLTTLWTECIEESVAHAALVTAPSGYGKSRLVLELLRGMRKDVPTAAVWAARGDALRAGAPFGLLAEALRGAAQIRRGDPLEVSRDRLRAYVRERVAAADRTRVTEFLGELTSVHFPDDTSTALFEARNDVRLMHEQIVRAWADLLRAECAARAVVLVLDDLQWGDAPSIRCVGRALAMLKNAPFFVVGLARPEVSHAFPKLWEQEGVVNLRLKELTRKAGAELVERALGERATPDLVERLVTQAGGHALYLEEMVRAVAEGRDDTAPEAVLALVGTRISQLPPEARRVLRAASIFGDVCWSGGVAALVADIGEEAALFHLDALVRHEMLVRRPESRFTGEIEYAFRHAMLREGASAMLTDTDRVLGHRLAGEWLEQHGESDPLVLAEHFARAEEHERAGTWFARTAEHAYHAGDADAAIRHARRGLALDLSTEQRGALLGVLCEAHAWRFEWDAAASIIDEALRLTRPGSTPWLHAATARLWLSANKGEFETLLAHIARIQEAALDPEATSVVALSLGISVFMLDLLGRFDLAEATLTHFGAVVTPVAAGSCVARGWLELARAHFTSLRDNDPWRGLSLSRAAFTSFQDDRYERGQPIALLCSGTCLWQLGAFEEAERTLRSAIVDWDLADFGLLRDYQLARALLDRGELDAAQGETRALLARAIELHNTRFEGRGHCLLALISLRSGDVVAAERESQLALDLTPSAVLFRGEVELTFASIQLAAGRAPSALRLIEDVLAACEAQGVSRLHARLAHAEALEAVGEHERARVELTATHAQLLADAEKISAPALKKSFLERVPEHARIVQRFAAMARRHRKGIT
ncbi:Adenylate cyclase [Minicystis rosea]|nr:Adenylate cyclase [Minicystis rosea]